MPPLKPKSKVRLLDVPGTQQDNLAAKSQCPSSDAELVARAATEYPSLAKVDFSAAECAGMVAEIDRLRAENARLRNVINALPCINESANEDCQQQGLSPEDTCEVCRLQWTIDGSAPAAPPQEPAERNTTRKKGALCTKESKMNDRHICRTTTTAQCTDKEGK